MKPALSGIAPDLADSLLQFRKKGKEEAGNSVLMERLFHALGQQLWLHGEIYRPGLQPSLVEHSLLFTGPLYSGFHGNITAGSFFLFTCSRSWENINLSFKCSFFLSSRTRRKSEVFFESWSARLPVNDGTSLGRAGRSVSPCTAPGCPGTHRSRGRSQYRRTDGTLNTCLLRFSCRKIHA